MIDICLLNNLPLADKESFYYKLMQNFGFQTIAKLASNNNSIIKFIGNIELGITSYQFLIHIIHSKEEVTKIDLENLRLEKNPHTNKGLIITTAKISKDAKKAKFKKDDITIDIIDKKELYKRLIYLNIGLNEVKN